MLKHITMAFVIGSISGIVLSEIIGDQVLARIWYVVAGIVVFVYINKFVIVNKPSPPVFEQPKPGDVTDLILKRDVIKMISDMSKHIVTISDRVQSMNAMLTNITGRIDADDHDDRVSIISDEPPRVRPTMKPIMGQLNKPISVKSTPTTIHEEVANNPPVQQKPVPFVPQIKTKASPPIDDSQFDILTDDEAARLDELVQKPVVVIMPTKPTKKPAITSLPSKPASINNIDHYADDIAVGDDPDSEE